MDLKQYLSEYLEWSRATKRPDTYRAACLAVKKFKVWLAAREDPVLDTEQVNARLFDMFVAHELAKGRKPNGINVTIRTLKAAFNRGVEWEYWEVSPLHRVKLLKVQKRPPRWIPFSDLVAGMAKVRDWRTRVLISAYLATGRRRSELHHLRWKDIDMERKQYLVRVSKSQEERWYPMNHAFIEIIESLDYDKRPEAKVFPWWQTANAVTHFVKIGLREMGLADHHLHDLRHSFAVAFMEKGGNLRTLQKLLGHAQYSTTEIYADVSTSHLASEVERIEIPGIGGAW